MFLKIIYKEKEVELNDLTEVGLEEVRNQAEQLIKDIDEELNKILYEK